MAGSGFSSKTSEHQWVDQLNQHFTIYVNNSASIFKVPKSILNTNPEAYSPQEVRLGGYHHLSGLRRRRVDDLDEGISGSRKLKAIKEYLKPEQYENFKSLIVDRLRNLEPLIRSSYDNYLDLDGDTLAWIMAIDGVFLLHLLRTYSSSSSDAKIVNLEQRKMAEDIFMLENQLPLIVLKEIKKALQLIPEEFDEDTQLISEMASFCESHTPLPLAPAANIVQSNSPHVLDVMHKLLMPELDRDEPFLDPNSQIKTKGDDPAGKSKRLKPLKLLAYLPLDELFDLFKRKETEKNLTNSTIQEIDIPSASQLHHVSNIQFKKRPPGSGNAIRYVEETQTLYLPVIKLNIDSEAIVRNLVAYESALLGDSNIKRVVSGYVDFMCGIIDTAEDVELLKKNGIIETELRSEDIAKIFNGMNKSGDSDDHHGLYSEKVNEVFHNTSAVKAWKFIRDRFMPSKSTAKLILGIMAVLLLTLQAFCQVYRCNSHRLFGDVHGLSSI